MATDGEQDYAPGEQLAPLKNISIAPVKAYSSVQFGPGEHDHFELNSDLLFSESPQSTSRPALPHTSCPQSQLRPHRRSPHSRSTVHNR